VRGIRITGWGIAVPDKVVTNDDLAVTLDTSNEWIVERTGIRERHIGGTTSGLAIEACQAALARAGRTPDEIDNLVLATTTPDGIVPGTAPSVQNGIGLTGGAFDLNAACSGFVYGLVTVAGLIAVGSGPVLLCSADPRRCRGSPTWTTAKSPSSWGTAPVPWWSSRSTDPAACSAGT
jgi:3-oxoacyl-[acyl-carrier-protein] synthase-3